MAQRKYIYSEVLLFIALVIVECSNVGLNTLFKVATTKGMSYYVYIVYSYGIATLVLMPFAFIIHRGKKLPPFNISLLCKIGFLGLIGFSGLLLGYKGIEFSSPTLASSISNLTPACTFVLAIIFRMEKLAIRSSSTQTKIIGTIVLVSGAFIVILYKGSAILPTLLPSMVIDKPQSPSQSNWTTGGLLLAADYLLISVWYIVQAQTVKKYRAEVYVVFLFNLCVTIISTPVCYMLEPNVSAWRIKSDVAMVSIIYAGVVGSALGVVVHTWGMKLKGPVYVASFRPLSIVIAAVTGVIFLGEALYLGSIIGAVVISIGFYAIMWGRAKEEMSEKLLDSSLESPMKEPLLQVNKNEEEEEEEDQQTHSAAQNASP